MLVCVFVHFLCACLCVGICECLFCFVCVLFCVCLVWLGLVWFVCFFVLLCSVKLLVCLLVCVCLIGWLLVCAHVCLLECLIA